MNIEPYTLFFLTEILCVVMRHDPEKMLRAEAAYDLRVEPRQSANDNH